MFATLVKIPSFVGNFVKSGILASFNNKTGEIHLEKSHDAKYDKEKRGNIFQKLLQNSLLPKIDEKAVMLQDRQDYSINDDDGIKLVEMSKQEYIDEFLEQKQLRFLTFKSKDEEHEDEETFHVIHPEEQDNSNMESSEYSFENINSRLNSFVKNTNPITTIQYLSLLLPNMLCKSITVITENIDQYLEGLWNDEWNVDDDRRDVNHSYHGHFTFFPNLEIEENIEKLKKYESIGDKIVIYNSEYETDIDNGWYVIKEYEKENKDSVDGNIRSELLQLGGDLISTVVLLVIKNIKKYLKKHHRKNNHHIYEEKNTKMYDDDDDDEECEETSSIPKKPVHKKINKNSINGSKLWSKVMTNIKKNEKRKYIDEPTNRRGEEEGKRHKSEE